MIQICAEPAKHRAQGRQTIMKNLKVFVWLERRMVPLLSGVAALTRRASAGAVICTALALVSLTGYAQTLQPIPPRLPYITGQYYKSHPAEWRSFLSALPARLPESGVPASQTLFSDNFDTDTVGTFPSNWTLQYNGAGTSYQKVDTTHFYSSPNALKLVGSNCWSADAQKTLPLPTRGVPARIRLEAKIFVDAIVTGGCTSLVAGMRFINPSIGSFGTEYGGINFTSDGFVYSGANNTPTKLMKYNAQTWYNVIIDMDFGAWTSNFYIDGTLVASDLPITVSGSAPTAIEVYAGHPNNPTNATAWFDDIVVSGAWQGTTNNPGVSGLSDPLLLTDGTVIVHQDCTANWYRLTPDINGSYVNGSWAQIGSLPSGYTPLYFASAVLVDGRVIINGGEYNSGCNAVWTNLGAIYDPAADSWTSVSPPTGWSTIGDAQSVVLPNLTYMLANCCTKQAALF